MARPDELIPYAQVAAIVAGWPRRQGYGPAIAERFGVPLATAGRWVAKARERGYLEPGTCTSAP